MLVICLGGQEAHRVGRSDVTCNKEARGSFIDLQKSLGK
jgi:hypothetical protein